MSNSSIEGKLKGLQERFENEMRIRREGGFPNQGALGTPRSGSSRRPRPPPMFANREIPAFPPRTPQATETEHRMREVYKVSGKLNVDGVEYRSHIDELAHQGELGSGTCGHVVKMLHKSSGAVIAVKQMRRSGNNEETKRILMDLDVVVRSHDCPYIVRCLGCFVTDADVWICMELMASCFDKVLKRLNGPIPEAILGKVTVATVNALSYLKDTHGVIHRDVKPSNILLDERGNIKLCDFGISGRLVDSKAKTRSAGCAAYMAPERIDPPDPARPDYDIRADVWSLGISLVELATGVFPYRDCQNDFEVLTRVIADDPPQLPDSPDFSTEFKSFVSQCLTKNYRQRPKYVKLLEHPFVVKSERSPVSVGEWYAALPTTPNTPAKARSVITTATHVISPPAVPTPDMPRTYAPSELPKNFVASMESPANFITSLESPRNYVTAPETPRRFMSATESSRNLVKSTETPRNFVTSTESPRNFVTTAETPRNFVTSAESPRNFVTSTESPRNFVTETPKNFATSSDLPRNYVTAAESPRTFITSVESTRNFANDVPRNFVTSDATRNFVAIETPKSFIASEASKVFGSESPRNFGNESPRGYISGSQYWAEHTTPTPTRARWATAVHAGGSSSQPASLEADYSSCSPFPRRRTVDACASPPPPPARKVSVDNRWKASPASSGNTSPIVLQRFYHQNQQRRSRVDLHSTPRHRSLSREHSTGRSPEPPPRTSRQHHMLGHELNGSAEMEPAALHAALHPPSPLLLNDRLSEGRSQSLTRAELRNGFRTELTAPVQAPTKLHHDDQDGERAKVGACPPRPSPRARRSCGETNGAPSAAAPL